MQALWQGLCLFILSPYMRQLFRRLQAITNTSAINPRIFDELTLAYCQEAMSVGHEEMRDIGLAVVLHAHRPFQCHWQ